MKVILKWLSLDDDVQLSHQGPAMITTSGAFCGWIRCMDKHIIAQRLKDNHTIEGEIQFCADFMWDCGGGRCCTGQISFNDLTMARENKNLTLPYIFSREDGTSIVLIPMKRKTNI